MRRRACERGQTATEYLGLLLLIAALTAAFASTSVAANLAGAIGETVCRIAGECDGGTPQAPDTPAPPAPSAIDRRYADTRAQIDRWVAQRRADGQDVPAWATDPNRRFLLFDPRGDGRVAEVFGDLGTARNVAVVVPGMDNELSNYSGANAQRLQREAEGLTPDGVATIQWLGYDTPEGLTGATQGPADDGARDLTPFLQSIRDLRAGDDLHVTVIGHSYGSLVLGKALKNTGLIVDDAVAIGSPGMGVDDAHDLGEGFDRLWAGRARWDPVGSAPVHGEDPHDVGFGAIRFHTGDISGHSSYFQEGSLSLHNLALIAAGRPQDVDVIK